jgi:hypothetical protein
LQSSTTSQLNLNIVGIPSNVSFSAIIIYIPSTKEYSLFRNIIIHSSKKGVSIFTKYYGGFGVPLAVKRKRKIKINKFLSSLLGCVINTHIFFLYFGFVVHGNSLIIHFVIDIVAQFLWRGERGTPVFIFV